MTPKLAATMDALTDMQRRVVKWDDGPLLVVAGPGAGKTQVLTCRVARLLDASPDERFRILGLTFTNKAAHEMRTRIATLVPDAAERAEINTFHGFCAQLLRQHGVHRGIKSNFEIYSRTADRQAVLEDALRVRPDCFGGGADRLLTRIDALKARLIGPGQASGYLRAKAGLSPEAAKRIGLAYRLYEEELSRSNALDFNSLICQAFELLKHPSLARHCRTVYRHWLIDEFQDTNDPQYRLLRRMAGDDFRRLFAVADDDQTIYEWNGANVQRIRSLVRDFGCEVIQLTDNFRCPPGVVEAANRLVVYNVRRDPGKAPAASAAQLAAGDEPEIQSRVFADEGEEACGIAADIAALGASERAETAVLARSRALLTPVRSALEALNVPVALLGRRDDFASPQVRWFFACLKQINRPLDRRNLATLAGAFTSFSGVPLDVEEVIVRSETDQVTPLAAWFDAVRQAAPPELPAVEAVAWLASGTARLADAVAKAMDCFEGDDADGALKDDLSAWRRLEREIRQARGSVTLDQFLQEMDLRSKEPAPAPGTVSLGTVHGSKGLEFDRVYLIGLAEGVFPSWHSVNRGNGSAAIEEERRNCFVAITRTKRRLILSRARSYRRWSKKPSRFLGEMGLLDQVTPP